MHRDLKRICWIKFVAIRINNDLLEVETTLERIRSCKLGHILNIIAYGYNLTVFAMYHVLQNTIDNHQMINIGDHREVLIH